MDMEFMDMDMDMDMVASFAMDNTLLPAGVVVMLCVRESGWPT